MSDGYLMPVTKECDIKVSKNVPVITDEMTDFDKAVAITSGLLKELKQKKSLYEIDKEFTLLSEDLSKYCLDATWS